jgi:hypothetical protein
VCAILAVQAKIFKINPQLFHNLKSACAKPVRKKFFMCASIVILKTSGMWKRFLQKRR